MAELEVSALPHAPALSAPALDTPADDSKLPLVQIAGVFCVWKVRALCEVQDTFCKTEAAVLALEEPARRASTTSAARAHMRLKRQAFDGLKCPLVSCMKYGIRRLWRVADLLQDTRDAVAASNQAPSGEEARQLALAFGDCLSFAQAFASEILQALESIRALALSLSAAENINDWAATCSISGAAIAPACLARVAETIGAITASMEKLDGRKNEMRLMGASLEEAVLASNSVLNGAFKERRAKRMETESCASSSVASGSPASLSSPVASTPATTPEAMQTSSPLIDEDKPSRVCLRGTLASENLRHGFGERFSKIASEQVESARVDEMAKAADTPDVPMNTADARSIIARRRKQPSGKVMVIDGKRHLSDIQNEELTAPEEHVVAATRPESPKETLSTPDGVSAKSTSGDTGDTKQARRRMARRVKKERLRDANSLKNKAEAAVSPEGVDGSKPSDVPAPKGVKLGKHVTKFTVVLPAAKKQKSIRAALRIARRASVVANARLRNKVEKVVERKERQQQAGAVISKKSTKRRHSETEAGVDERRAKREKKSKPEPPKNCLEVLMELKRQWDAGRGLSMPTASEWESFVSSVNKKLCGLIVFAKQNNIAYEILGVDFEKSPLSSFSFKEKEISFADYLKHQYNLEVTQPKQPMFRCVNPNKKSPSELDKSAAAAASLIAELSTSEESNVSGTPTKETGSETTLTGHGVTPARAAIGDCDMLESPLQPQPAQPAKKGNSKAKKEQKPKREFYLVPEFLTFHRHHDLKGVRV
eukprot:tig00000980_g6135.t1